MEDFNSFVQMWLDEKDHRENCQRCRRSQRVCLCSHFPAQPILTHSHILIIQHPKEALQLSIGSVNLIKNCLGPSCTVLVGLDFSKGRFAALDAAFDSQKTVLLFPGDGAVSLTELRQQGEPRGNGHPEDPAALGGVAKVTQPGVGGGYTVVVVDGTWAQAKKLMTLNPQLHQLRKVYLDHKALSEYNQLRKEPKEFFLSTLESVAQVLHILEPDSTIGKAAHDSLLSAFRAMVQLESSFVPQGSAKKKTPLVRSDDLTPLVTRLFHTFLATKRPVPRDAHFPKRHWTICRASHSLDGTYLCQPILEGSFHGTLDEVCMACKWLNAELGFKRGNKLSPIPLDMVQTTPQRETQDPGQSS